MVRVVGDWRYPSYHTVRGTVHAGPIEQPELLVKEINAAWWLVSVQRQVAVFQKITVSAPCPIWPPSL